MRITIVMGFFLPVPPLQGGAVEKIWLRLAQELAALGHDVTCISRRWPGLPNWERTGSLTHCRLPGMNHTGRLWINLLLDFVWGLRVLGKLPPGDAVICNTVSLPIYLRPLRPAAGKVFVVLGRMPKGQIRFYGQTDCLLATSEAVAARCRYENPRISNRVVLLANPIDWELHANNAVRTSENDPVVIGYVGRIHPEKGLEHLLDAAVWLKQQNAVPAWRMRLIGPVSVPQGGGGEAYRDALIRRYAPQLGEHLELLPPVFDSTELARHYGAMHVFCYPSLAAKGEGLSVAPLEAMAAGAVPVLSRLDCYRDVLQPGVNGFDFDHTRPRNEIVATLGEILSRLARDPLLRRSLADAAQKTARFFDYSEAARTLSGHLEHLTAARPKR